MAVTGVTAQYAHLYQLLGWKLEDPIEELKSQIQELKEQADVFVLLSHLVFMMMNR